MNCKIRITQAIQQCCYKTRNILKDFELIPHAFNVIDFQRKTFYYNIDYIKKIDDSQLKSLLEHEVIHTEWKNKEQINNTIHQKCQCGAKHTSNIHYHLSYCPLYNKGE